MSTSVEVATACAKLITASDLAHAIANGPATGEGSLIATDAGLIPTLAKQAADFTAAGAEAIENLSLGLPEIIFAVPVSAKLPSPGLLVFVADGDETAVDGNYIDLEPVGLPVERWTFRDVADPELFEIQLQSNWSDTVYIFAQQLKLRSVVAEGRFYADAFDRPCVTLVSKVETSGISFTLDNYAGVLVASEILLMSGNPGVVATVAGNLGERKVVAHTDGTQTAWHCTRVTPPEWMPNTTGILKDRTSGLWVRAYYEGSSLQQETLPNQ
jgi:hypothetical protein